METKIGLIEKQPEIAGNIDKLYGNGKRFAGVVLSTGGGKSFIAMDQIVKAINSFNNRNNYIGSADSLVLSNCPILYFSPTHIVNGQFRTHMTKFIIAPEYLAQEKKAVGEISRENAEKILYKVLEKMRIQVDEKERKSLNDELLKNILNETNDISIEKIVLDLIQNKLEKCSSAQKYSIVKNAFPKLHFRAYKNLEKVKDNPDEITEEVEQEDLTDINSIKPEFIILDEAHRTGADTWWKKLQKYLERNNQAKVLAITATPERDVDQMNMMRELSGVKGMGYSTRERRKEEYLAGNYPLLEAIKQGMVEPPEVVHFDMTLDESSEFKDMLRDFVLAYINLQKQPIQRSNYSDSYINANQRQAETEEVLKQALILIMKDPSGNDLDETTTKIEGEKSKAFEKNTNIGLLGNLKRIIKDAYANDLIKADSKANSPEMDNLIDVCYDYIQKYQWKDGKTWDEVKAERVSKLIEEKLVQNGLEHGKALTFIDSMQASSYTDAKSHREKALKYIGEKIDGIKKLVGKIGGIDPIVTALHSAAYTQAENDTLLNQFMKQPIDKGPFKIIAAVQKFNEGFHPDGISAELMIKEISENKEKTGEPRIVLLQQLRKGYFC